MYRPRLVQTERSVASAHEHALAVYWLHEQAVVVESEHCVG